MKRNLLSLALVLVMALSLMTVTAFATDPEDLDSSRENQEITLVDPETCQHNFVDGICTLCKMREPEPSEPVTDTPTATDTLTVETDTLTVETNTSTVTNTPTVTTPAPSEPVVTTPEPAAPTNGGQPLDQNVGEKQQTDPADSTKETHTHTLKQAVPAKAATCTTPGNKAYWICNCDLWFEDANFATQITDKKSVVIPALEHNYDNGYCTLCNAKDPSPSQPHICKPEAVSGKAATCTEAGVKEHYKCVCGKYYFVQNSIFVPITASDTVIPATGHKAPPAASFTADKITSSHHTYDCMTCGQAGISERHTPNSSGVCTVCGFNGPITSNPSPSNYISISSAHLNSYSISLTWTSDLPDGTVFDIYVDNDVHRTVSLSRTSGGYFSYTVEYGSYLGDRYYDVSVRAGSVYSGTTRLRNGDYDWDYDYWYDHYYPNHYYPNSTPSTNSYGIPYASQVGGRYSAAEAIRILRGKNQYNLQNDLMTSSSALDSYERLESAVKRANNVSVTVSSSGSNVPSPIRGKVSITGAAFNASSTNSTVRLSVDRPSVNRYAGRGYQFSMSLSGVGGDSSLDVPVVVSMPLPSDISPNYVKVLHYHNSNVPTVITPKVSGGRISFPLTGFSDFVITDDGVPNYTYIADGYGGYYVPVPSAPRRSLVDEHLSVILPLVASTPVSGYVYDDVSGTYWAAAQIAWARDGGLMTGYYDGTFRPWAGTTRQELWMVLARLSGANPADMAAARQWAMNIGITDGTNPYSPLSRQQMISMLYRYASYRRMDLTAPSNLGYYRDGASVSAYARTAMNWATNKAIITGDSNGYLHPQDIATRADFAVYLYRFLQ